MLDRYRYPAFTNEFEYGQYRGIKIIRSIGGKLAEEGPNMDPFEREELRTHIDLEFEALGLKPGDYPGLRRLNESLHQLKEFVIFLPRYPSIKEFGKNYSNILRASKVPVNPNAMFPAKESELPDVPRIPLATDVAQYSQYDWRSIKGRGGTDDLHYLYNLGMFMLNPFKYKTTFEEDFKDIIKVGPQWSIENGYRRALALRILGPEYVEKSGMNRWVTVRREDPTESRNRT